MYRPECGLEQMECRPRTPSCERICSFLRQPMLGPNRYEIRVVPPCRGSRDRVRKEMGQLANTRESEAIRSVFARRFWGLWEAPAHRSSPFSPSASRPTMPSADICAAVREPRGSLSPGSGDATQISRGKFDRLPRAPAGFAPRALDGYGLRDQLPARPALTLPIRFLFVESRLCSAPPSDPASRRHPCASLSLHLHQVG